MLQGKDFRNNLNVLGLRQAAGNSTHVCSHLHNNSARHHFSFLQRMPLWFRVVRSLVQGQAAKTWPRWKEKIKGI